MRQHGAVVAIDNQGADADIDDEHRVVYQVAAEEIVIAQLRGHDE